MTLSEALSEKYAVGLEAPRKEFNAAREKLIAAITPSGGGEILPLNDSELGLFEEALENFLRVHNELRRAFLDRVDSENKLLWAIGLREKPNGDPLSDSES